MGDIYGQGSFGWRSSLRATIGQKMASQPRRDRLKLHFRGSGQHSSTLPTMSKLRLRSRPPDTDTSAARPRLRPDSRMDQDTQFADRLADTSLAGKPAVQPRIARGTEGARFIQAAYRFFRMQFDVDFHVFKSTLATQLQRLYRVLFHNARIHGHPRHLAMIPDAFGIP